MEQTKPLILQIPEQTRVSLYDDRTGERMEVVEKLVNVAKSQFVTWTSFQSPLPPSVFISEGSGNAVLQTQEIFKPVEVINELSDVARGDDGRLKRLTPEQLRDIYKSGTFKVASKQFPGRFHQWRVSHVVQKGTDNISYDARSNCACACRLFCVSIPDCLGGRTLSVRDGLSAIGESLWDFFSLTIGMPERKPRYEPYEINNLMYHYKFCYVMDGLNESKERGTFVTPDGLFIDLRLQYQPLQDTLRPVFEEASHQAEEAWERVRVNQRMDLERALRARGTWANDKELFDQQVADDLARRHNDFVLERLRHVELPPVANSKVIRELVIREYRAVCIAEEVKRSFDVRMDNIREHAKQTYSVNHGVFGLIPELMDNYVTNAEKEARPALDDPFDMTVNRLKEAGLKQHAYLADRERKFVRERAPPLIKQLTEEKVPRMLKKLNIYTWSPEKWRIHQNEEGRYYATEGTHLVVGTQTPFWRILLVIMRAAAWLPNVLYFLIFVNLWYGPFGIKALFKTRHFYGNKTVDPNTGQIVQDTASKTHSMISLIGALWKSVLDSRDRFEREPDTGLLSKSVTRVFNVVWNYVVKGFIGTLLILVLYMGACPLNIILSVVLILTAIAWVPMLTLFIWAFSIVLWDVDTLYGTDFDCELDECWDGTPKRGRGVACRRTKWFFLPVFMIMIRIFLGGLEICLALFYVLVVAPVISALVLVFSTLRRVLRHLYDSCCYCCVLAPRARVPAVDSFIARRVAGPGMGSAIFATITPEQALLEVQRQLERDELDAFEKYTKAKLQQPLRDYGQFVSQINSVLGGPNGLDQTFRNTHFRDDHYLANLNARLAERRRLLVPATSLVRSTIRVTDSSLRIILELCDKLVKPFCQQRIFKYLTSNEVDRFFSAHEVEDEDWRGITVCVLRAAFGPTFLQPLEEAEMHSHLVVEHIDLTEYVRMVLGADSHDDLERAHAVTVIGSTPVPARVKEVPIASLAAQDKVVPELEFSYWSFQTSVHNETGLTKREWDDSSFQCVFGAGMDPPVNSRYEIDMEARCSKRVKRQARLGHHGGSDSSSDIERRSKTIPASALIADLPASQTATPTTIHRIPSPNVTSHVTTSAAASRVVIDEVPTLMPSTSSKNGGGTSAIPAALRRIPDPRSESALHHSGSSRNQYESDSDSSSSESQRKPQFGSGKGRSPNTRRRENMPASAGLPRLHDSDSDK